jgi:hypothetical protein
MDAMGLLGSIRTPKDNRNMNNQTLSDNEQPARPEQQDQRDSRFPNNRPRIIPMFQSKREAIFFLMLSLNMGGADLSADATVDEATRQADAMEARNVAVWYRKRPYNGTGKDFHDKGIVKSPQQP